VGGETGNVCHFPYLRKTGWRPKDDVLDWWEMNGSWGPWGCGGLADEGGKPPLESSTTKLEIETNRALTSEHGLLRECGRKEKRIGKEVG